MCRLLLVAAIACAGCAGASGIALTDPHATPGASAALRTVHRVAVLMNAEAERYAPGAVPVHSPERSRELGEQATAAIRAALARRGLEAVPLADDAELRQVSLLFDRVASSAFELTPPVGVEHRFSYGLGGVETFLDPAHADHLLLVDAALGVPDLDGFGEGLSALRIVLGVCDRQGRLLWLRAGASSLGRAEPQRRAVERLVGALAAELGEGP